MSWSKDLREQGASAVFDNEVPPYDAPDFIELHDIPPQIVEADGSKTWVMRGQNFAMTYTEAKRGARLERRNHESEYMVVLPEAIRPEDPQADADIVANADSVRAPSASLSIVPPGDSAVTMLDDGIVVRIFGPDAADLLKLAANAASYATPHVRVAPHESLPEPAGGYALRCYPFSEHPPVWHPSGQPERTRAEDTRYGRYFQSTNLMVHLQARVAPRDERRTFPHSTPDYEHASLQLVGSRVHHVRTPWVPDTHQWRDDIHYNLPSPGFLVFPPGVIHTTQSVSPISSSICVYSPPRASLSKPNRLINSDDYPMKEADSNSLPQASWA